MATDPATLFKFGVPPEQAPVRSQEMRDNFEALVRSLFTTDPTQPADARTGMIRILEDPATPGNLKLQAFITSNWQTLLQNIQSGVAAPAKIIVTSFQTPPGANPWVIDHNLGTKPFVQVLTSPAPFNQLTSRLTPKREVRFLGRLPTTSLAAGPVRTGILLPNRGTLLSTFAFCETAISAPAVFTIDFVLNKTGGPVLLTPEGDIIVLGALARGVKVAGVAITTPGIGVFAENDTLDIGVTVTTSPPDGALEIYGEFDRPLADDEYKLLHVDDNRVNIDFAKDTAGIAILVG